MIEAARLDSAWKFAEFSYDTRIQFTFRGLIQKKIFIYLYFCEYESKFLQCFSVSYSS